MFGFPFGGFSVCFVAFTATFATAVLVVIRIRGRIIPIFWRTQTGTRRRARPAPASRVSVTVIAIVRVSVPSSLLVFMPRSGAFAQIIFLPRYISGGKTFFGYALNQPRVKKPRIKQNRWSSASATNTFHIGCDKFGRNSVAEILASCAA